VEVYDAIKRKDHNMKKEENEEEEGEEYSTILKVEDYDWSDITPIKQDDGPDPVVMIAYQEECELYKS
jgi:hypothetical protein